jgi:hypothetical protein
MYMESTIATHIKNITVLAMAIANVRGKHHCEYSAGDAEIRSLL